MTSRIAAIAAATLIASAAAALAQSNAPGIDQTPSKTRGTGRTITSQSPEAHNPAVNPNAAGLQRGWRGYGASQQQPAPRPTRRRGNASSASGY